MLKKIGYAAALVGLVPLAACQKEVPEVPEAPEAVVTEPAEAPAIEMPAEETSAK